MSASYKIDDSLNWRMAEEIKIHPRGWKPLSVKYIDSSPYIFWRINGVDKNFRSLGNLVAQKGPNKFFCESLESLKIMVNMSLDVMTPERREFYIKNIIGLFDD